MAKSSTKNPTRNSARSAGKTVAKATIRREILQLREKQSDSVKSLKDAKILGQLGQLQNLCDAKEIFTYISHKGEVGTDTLIKKYFGKKKIIVPKIVCGGTNRKKSGGAGGERGADVEVSRGAGGKICLFELRDALRFERGKYGIREPVICMPHRTYKSIDVALVPGIAFDKNGHRIGYGGGYFDHLLKKLRCTTIGLAYEFQIIDKVPTHGYDVPVDFIVTERRIIRCGKKSDKSVNP